MDMDTQGYGSDSLNLYWKLIVDNSVQQLLSCKDRMNGYLPSPTFDYENEISWIHPPLPHVKETLQSYFKMHANKPACIMVPKD